MNEIDTEKSSEKKPLTAPEHQDSGTYIGLLLGGIILTTGAIVLFNDLYSTFSAKGIDITFAIIFSMGLMLASAYGAISCFFAIYRIAFLNKLLSKKIGEEFEDFVLYTKPFIEEVIRQRLVVEKVIDKLEALEKRSIESASAHPENPNPDSIKWWEFLLFVALLTNISIGLYVYLEAHPFEMVPYSVIILGIAWWVLMARYFGLLFDPRAVYIPAFFVAVLPTLSIMLRIYLAPYQALFVVFLVLFFYVAAMYYHYKYLTTGISPFSITKLKEELAASKKARAEKQIAVEIEDKKKSILERALLRISKPEPVQESSPLPVSQIGTEQVEINVKDVISSAFMIKIRKLRLILTDMVWPQQLCQSGKKISLAGVILASLGAVSIIALGGTYGDISLEAIFIGIIMLAAGHSIAGKEGKRVFAIGSFLLPAGVLLSLGAAVSFYFLSPSSLEENIFKITIQYTAGLFLLVLDILIARVKRKNNL